MEKAGKKKRDEKGNNIVSPLFIVPRVRYVFRAMNEKKETRSLPEGVLDVSPIETESSSIFPGW